MAGNTGAKPAAKKSDDSKNKIKIIFAASALVVGGLLIAWQLGWLTPALEKTGITSAPPPPKLTPELQKSAEKQKKKMEEMEKAGTAPATAGS